MTFSWKNFFIGLLIVLIDLAVYVFLGIASMAYEDFYDESKGKYWSWESMTTFDKIINVSLGVWNLINIIAILYIFYRFIKQFQKHKQNLK